MDEKDLNNEIENNETEVSIDDIDAISESVDEIQEIEENTEISTESTVENEPVVEAQAFETESTETTGNNIQSDVDFDFDSNEEPDNMVTVRPVKFQQFEPTEPKRSIKRNLDIMQDISMHISVELGKAKSTIKEVMDLSTGSIVELDKIAGEQVEIYANNKIIAKGEVIVIEDKFGVRVTSTNIPKTIQ